MGSDGLGGAEGRNCASYASMAFVQVMAKTANDAAGKRLMGDARIERLLDSIHDRGAAPLGCGPSQRWTCAAQQLPRARVNHAWRGLARRQVDAQVGKHFGWLLPMPATDHEVTVGIVQGRELYPDLAAVMMNPEDAETPALGAHLDQAIVQGGKPPILEGQPCWRRGTRLCHHARRYSHTVPATAEV